MFENEINIVVYKTDSGENILELSSVYKNNCSEQKTEIVSEAVLEVYEDTRKEQERHRSWNRRHRNKKVYFGNEGFEAQLGMITYSPEEQVHSEIYLEYLKQFFDEKVYARGMMYYMGKLSEKQIAEIENVSQAAISKSISTFKLIMAKLYNIDNE